MRSRDSNRHWSVELHAQIVAYLGQCGSHSGVVRVSVCDFPEILWKGRYCGVPQFCSLVLKCQKWTNYIHTFSKLLKFLKSVQEKYFSGSVKVNKKSKISENLNFFMRQNHQIPDFVWKSHWTPCMDLKYKNINFWKFGKFCFEKIEKAVGSWMFILNIRHLYYISNAQKKNSDRDEFFFASLFYGHPLIFPTHFSVVAELTLKLAGNMRGCP